MHPDNIAPPANEALKPEQLLQLLRDGVMGLDRDGRITYLNQTGEQLLSIKSSAALGHNLADILPNFHGALNLEDEHEGDRPHFRPLASSISLGGRVTVFEFNVHRHEQGTIILFRDVQGHDTDAMQVTRLNATLLASQELLRHKNEELNRSLEQLEKLNESISQVESLKSEIIDNTSHELRTPLNSMIGSLQLVKEELCDSREEEMECVNNALDSANHLLALINDMLEISKIEAGKVMLMIANHNIGDIFEDVYSMTQVLAERKDLTLDFKMPEIDGLTVRVDVEKTRQVLINIVGNAVKFTETGSVTVWAEADSANPDLIRFFVRDTGIGLIGGDELFDKFIQLDSSNTRRFNGTGLGLAITRHLVELMGGSIELHSEGKNQGTTVIFTLPAGTRSHAKNLLDEDLDFEIDEDSLPSTF